MGWRISWSPQIQSASSNTRRVYLVLGSSITPGVDFDLANADYTFTTEETEDDHFAASAIGIGDYDGDGLDDLLFSAQYHGFMDGYTSFLEGRWVPTVRLVWRMPTPYFTRTTMVGWVNRLPLLEM